MSSLGEVDQEGWTTVRRDKCVRRHVAAANRRRSETSRLTFTQPTNQAIKQSAKSYSTSNNVSESKSISQQNHHRQHATGPVGAKRNQWTRQSINQTLLKLSQPSNESTNRTITPPAQTSCNQSIKRRSQTAKHIKFASLPQSSHHIKFTERTQRARNQFMADTESSLVPMARSLSKIGVSVDHDNSISCARVLSSVKSTNSTIPESPPCPPASKADTRIAEQGAHGSVTARLNGVENELIDINAKEVFKAFFNVFQYLHKEREARKYAEYVYGFLLELNDVRVIVETDSEGLWLDCWKPPRIYLVDLFCCTVPDHLLPQGVMAVDELKQEIDQAIVVAQWMLESAPYEVTRAINWIAYCESYKQALDEYWKDNPDAQFMKYSEM